MVATTDLNALERLTNAATSGPWKANSDAEILNLQEGEWYWMDVTQEDAEFIASARNVLPEIFADIRQYQKAIENKDHLISQLSAEIRRLTTVLATNRSSQKFHDLLAEKDKEIERLKAELERLASIDIGDHLIRVAFEKIKQVPHDEQRMDAIIRIVDEALNPNE